MCPLYPFHVFLLYLCLLLPLLFAVIEGSEELASWKIGFSPSSGIKKLKEENVTQAAFVCEDCPVVTGGESAKFRLRLGSNDPKVASIRLVQENREEFDGIAVAEYQQIEQDEDDNQKFEFTLEVQPTTTSWSIPFDVTGNFLGLTRISAEVSEFGDQEISRIESSLDVSVIKERALASKMFSYSVALLITLAYVNMGCALDVNVVKENLRRPIGPLIGFVCQFIVMPVLAFVLGFSFYDNPPLRLGLFVTGVSPGGGASNIWTFMFGGNLNLSLTMTAVSNFAAFAMMPLWIFGVGPLILNDRAIVIPYYKIFIYVFCLVVPLGIGLALQKWLPKAAKFMVKILKPMALFLILFILIFGVWANFYMFKLMNWQVWLTGMGLPWLGFACGCTIARLTNRSTEDVIAIAIETGVQNTGMSIFILWFTFDHPVGDIAAVVPVACATMTPFPLMAALFLVKLRQWRNKEAPTDQPMCPFKEGEQAVRDLQKDVMFHASESSQKLLKKSSSPEPEDNREPQMSEKSMRI